MDGTVDPMLLGASVNYDLGGLSVVAAGEYHEDAYGLRTITGANAGRTASKDMAWRLAPGTRSPSPSAPSRSWACWSSSPTRRTTRPPSATASRTTAASPGSSAPSSAWATTSSAAASPRPSARAARTADGADCDSAVTDELAATQYAVGYAYHLAKSTQVYAYYTQIMNNDLAQYTFTVGGAQTATGGNVFGATPAGADPTAVGVGIRYAF